MTTKKPQDEAPQVIQSDLCLIQNKLNAPKKQWNNHGGYWYRNSEDILTGLKPLLLQYGCDLRITDELIDVAGNPVIKAVVYFTDSKGKEYESSSFAGIKERKGMDFAQSFGAASSYARKYALNAMFLIDDVKDPDSDAFQGQPQNNQPQNNQPQNNQPQPMRDVTPKQKQFVPNEARFIKTLERIRGADNPQTLNDSIRFFQSTQYASDIEKACFERAQQMGWSK